MCKIFPLPPAAGARGAGQGLDLRVVRAGGPPHVPDAVGRARPSPHDDEDGLRRGLPLDAPPLPGQGGNALATQLALNVHGRMAYVTLAWVPWRHVKVCTITVVDIIML